MRRLTFALASAASLLVGLTAHATPLTDSPIPPQPIAGGTVVEECGWPTAVTMLSGTSLCTGTLVHPELVVFAAHCMYFSETSPAFVGFGETLFPSAREVPTQSCTMFPEWDPSPASDGFDVAFCVLAEPVLDVPIVPILMGCETEVLELDQEVTLVGYGETDTGPLGTKHKTMATLDWMGGETEINIGGDGVGSCSGDSGGPAYVRLADGSWRVFGINSRGSGCGGVGVYGLIHGHVQWIEDTSGLDVTPCHDADGTWNPSDACTGFPLDPGLGTSDWAAGCATPLGGPSATCGDPIEEEGTSTSDTGLDDSGGSLDTGPLDDATTGTLDSSSDGSDTAGATDEDTGCGCRANTRLPGGLVLLLLALPLRRRRHR